MGFLFERIFSFSKPKNKTYCIFFLSCSLDLSGLLSRSLVLSLLWALVLQDQCCFVLLNQYWGINVRSRGFLTSEPRRHAPTIQNRWRETSTCLPQTTWGGQILTLHLSYVAGYTTPLLFLFERTQQLTALTTRGKPWRLRVWAGPKFVRPHW